MKTYKSIRRVDLVHRAADRAKRLEMAIANLNSDLEKIGGIAGLDSSAIKAVRKEIQRVVLSDPI